MAHLLTWFESGHTWFEIRLATSYQRPPFCQALIATLGGAVGIGLLALISEVSGSAILMAPLGATAVLVFGLPGSPLSQPRHVIGGHALAMAVGLICFYMLGNGVLAVGIGSGLALGLMLITRTVHPPAGANPLLLMFMGTNVSEAALQIALPGVVGAALLYLVAASTHYLSKRGLDLSKRGLARKPGETL